MPICNLILCPPRSGSSCIAGCLYYSGFDFGKKVVIGADKFNRKGYFENDSLLNFNSRLLHSHGGILQCDVQEFPDKISELREIILREFGDGPIVIKDPRVFRLGNLYFEVLKDWDIQIIHVLRGLEASLKSLKRMFRRSESVALEGCYHFYHDGVRTLGEKWPYCEVKFEEVLGGLDPVRDLVEFCGGDPSKIDVGKLAPFLGLESGNPYRDSPKSEYSLGEAIHWVGGKLNLGGRLLGALCDRELRHNSRVLEVGPGCFRCSRPLIRFLDEGCYYCVEGDAKLLGVGLRVKLGDLASRVKWAVNWDFDVGLFEAGRFDYIVAQGVVCHIPEGEFRDLLGMVVRQLAYGGEFWLSFIEGKRTDCNPFKWSVRNIAKFCDDARLEFEYLGGWGHPRGLVQGVVRHRMARRCPWRSPIAVGEALRDIVSGKRVCDLGCAEGDLLLVLSQFASSVIGVEHNMRRGRVAVSRGFDVMRVNYLKDDLPLADVYYCWPDETGNLLSTVERFENSSAIVILGGDTHLEHEVNDIMACKDKYGGELRTVEYNEGQRGRRRGKFLLLVIEC